MNKRKHTQTSLETLGTNLERLRTKAEANTEEDGPKQGYQTPTE
jgi:hypothetical protein